MQYGNVVYGYRFFRDGRMGCTFLENGREICATSERKAPGAPVFITGRSGAWKTDFDREITRIPGLRLDIRDVGTGETAVELVFLSFTAYVIHCGGEKVISAAHRFGYDYYRDEEPVADCTRDPKDAPVLELFGYRLPACLGITFYEPMDERMKQALITFPSVVLLSN